MLPRPCLVAAAVLLVVAATSCGDDAGSGTNAATPAHTREASPADLSAFDWPSLASRRIGDTWLACIAWEGGADSLEVRPVRTSLAAGSPRSAPVRVYQSPTRLLGTALGADRSDALHLVWSEQVEQGWALRELVFPPGTEGAALGEAGAPVTLVSEPGRHALQPSIAADADGRLLLTWLVVDAAGMQIMGRVHDGERGWGPAVSISGPGRSAWSQEAAATGPGRFAVVWDSAASGDYDVYLARLELDAQGAPTVGPRQRVTDTPRFEAHPSIAAHGERLYVAYDVGPEHWGHEGSTNHLDEALHASRHVELVGIEGGQVMPLNVTPMFGMNDALVDNCELPRVRCESTGNIVLFFRGLPLPPEFDDPENAMFQDLSAQKPGGAGFRTSIWITYMMRYDGVSWLIGDRHHMPLPGSPGRADAPCAASTLPGGGTAYAVVGDGRETPTTAANGQPISPAQAADASTWWGPVTRQATQVTAALVKKEAAASAVMLDQGQARPLAAAPTPHARPALPTRSFGGASLQLALGDLHRHTDISRCSANWDGPLGDALRYASDVAPLQFLAITDHFEHMTAYDWWRTVSTMDAFDAPGRLVTLRGYERCDPATGHRNVISGDDGPPLVGYPGQFEPGRDAVRADSLEELWQALASQRVLTIPHTPAGMFPANPSVFDWSSFDPAHDRLVEIFQSYRGSSEAADAPRAIPDLKPSRYVRPNLDLGFQFGLIASSDHQTSDGAFAGTWVGDLTREGVYDALFARLTFASTVPASLWMEWNGVPMGRSVQQPAGTNGTLTVEVDGFGRELATLEVITDGGTSQQRALTGSVARESLSLDAPASGTRYAYVRITFADGEMMWSSPVRLTANEWDGPDGPSGRQVLERHGDVWQVKPHGRR